MARTLLKFVLLPSILLVGAGSIPTKPVPARPRDCGDCGAPLGSSIGEGSYKFDSSVPDYLKQAAYFADDAGFGQYYDQANGATTISVVPSSTFASAQDPTGHNTLGASGVDTTTQTGVIYVNQYWVDMCSSACNMLIGTINHEFGHVLGGLDDIWGGCTDSIMSYSADIWNITSPSSEDLCHAYNWGYGINWDWDDCPEQPCVPYRKYLGRGGGGS